jgi:hypothetical protein
VLREARCHDERDPGQHAEERPQSHIQRSSGGPQPAVLGPLFELMMAVEDASAMSSEWRAGTLPAHASAIVSNGDLDCLSIAVLQALRPEEDRLRAWSDHSLSSAR